MKKTLVFLAISVSTSALAQDQMIDASQVPQTIKTTFEKRYPGITPQWEYEDGKFDAEYKQDGKKIEILFDRQGNSAQKISMNDLSPVIISYVNTHYMGEKIKKVKKLVSSHEDVSYQCFIQNKSLLFNADGKFLEEKADK